MPAGEFERVLLLHRRCGQVHNGASYYHYAFGKKLARALTKALDDELVQHQETKAD